MDVELAEGGRISQKWEAEHEWQPVKLDTGDLLIFGSHLAHRSAPNNTAKPRASVYATYHMVSDGTDLRKRYYIDRRENFPPDHGELHHLLLTFQPADKVQNGYLAKTTALASSGMRSLRRSQKLSRRSLRRRWHEGDKNTAHSRTVCN